MSKFQEDGSGGREQGPGVGGCPHDVTGKQSGHVPTVRMQDSVKRGGGVAASPLLCSPLREVLLIEP